MEIPRRARVADVLAVASYLWVLPAAQIRGEQRNRRYLAPRFAVCLVSSEQGHSYPMIGRVMGRDHSSVIHAARRAREMMARDPQYAHMVERLRLLSSIAKPFVADRIAA